MEKPSATGPIVEHGTLVYEDQGQRMTSMVGTPHWYAWLETATTFTFACEEGTFTAHKARAGNRRGGWYWRAYRWHHGQILRCYLGVPANLTLSCLHEAARRLAKRAEGASSRKAAEDTRQEAQIHTSSDVPIPLPIVTTKCAFPRLPVQHVPRTRLVALLERGAVLPLTLVSAPAGSGKTTLLAEWARTTQMPVAWLSLEPADSDPARFLMYMFTALHTLNEQGVKEARKFLDTNPVLNVERVLSLLVNDLASSLATDVALVLDDYHVLESETAHTALLFLLEHLPQRLHLVIGTRIDPPLPLARLRARGHVNEIRTDALRFVASEVKAFVHEMELDLAEETLDSLEERTEGWVAGLQLALLALRGRDDHEVFLRKLRGTHRFLLEYIREEILARLTPQVCTFLLQTSILERLSGSLCDAVTGGSESQTMLEELRKANLFVSALDETGAWYRYHPLFAEGLRHQLLQQEPVHFQELCSRASIWYEAHEMLLEACEYALAARDFPRAVPLMEQQVSKLVGHAQLPLLRRWLEQLPPAIISTSLLLSVASTWTLYVEDGVSERLKQAIALLQQRFEEPAAEAETERAQWIEARANLNFMLIVQALDENDTARALELARQTLQALPAHATELRSLATLCLRLAQGMAYRLNGDFAAAERSLIEAGTQIYATNYHYLNLIVKGSLADMYEARGELRKSAQLYQQLFLLFGSRKEILPEMTGWISMSYANLLLEWNRLDEAEDFLRQALNTYSQTQIKEFARECLLIQHRLYLARGRYEEALKLLDEIEENLSSMQPSHPMAGLGVLARTRTLLSQGKVHEAALCLSARGLSYDDAFYDDPSKEPPGAGDMLFAEYMTMARVLIAQGRTAPGEQYLTQALALLQNFHALSVRAGLTRRVIEIQALTSLALQAQGETRAALLTLERAVKLAEPAGFIRLFADEGEPLARLLVRLPVQNQSTKDYVRTLLEATSSGNVPGHEAESRRNKPIVRLPLIDSLSEREYEVLPLLAEGYSNQQIAAHLVITPNTVKRHVKHILAKLAATNRVQAVARARELHLL